MADPEPDPNEAVAALEYYQRQLDALSRQVELLQGVIDDLLRARRALEGLSEESSDEVLVPLGASTFVKAKVTQKDSVISGIGAGYATERPRDEATKKLEERESQARAELERLMQAVVQVQQEAARIQDHLDAAGG